MEKEDIKAIFLIIILLVLMAILAIFGINIYLKLTGNESTVLEIFEERLGQVPANVEIQNTAGKLEEQGNSQLDEVQIPGEQKEDTTSSNRYFYDQLNSYSKTIYEKFASNKESMKTGTYKLEFGETFNDLLEQENGSELLQDYYQSAVETFLNDNPDVFYLAPTKMYINIKTIKKVFYTTYDVYIDSGKMPNYLSDEFNSKQEIIEAEEKINNEVEKIFAKIEKGTDYEKILMIHDYLVNNCSFDESLQKSNIYNLYGAIVNKEAVCEGYTKAFKYFMDKIGIECIMVIGTATNSENITENHAWNYVNLKNKWYAIDVTWDDPIVRGHGYVGNDIKYKYFLKGSTTIDKDHVKSGQFTEEGQIYTYPTLSISDY